MQSYNHMISASEEMAQAASDLYYTGKHGYWANVAFSLNQTVDEMATDMLAMAGKARFDYVLRKFGALCERFGFIIDATEASTAVLNHDWDKVGNIVSKAIAIGVCGFVGSVIATIAAPEAVIAVLSVAVLNTVASVYGGDSIGQAFWDRYGSSLIATIQGFLTDNNLPIPEIDSSRLPTERDYTMALLSSVAFADYHDLYQYGRGTGIFANRIMPDGWSVDIAHSYASGNNQLVVFINDSTKDIVFTFRSGSYAENLTCNISDGGYAAWEALKPYAVDSLNNILSDSAYSGYKISANGYGYGGCMSQAFALENYLEGYGQNSLPIANQIIEQDFTNEGRDFYVEYALYPNLCNFYEVNTVGDIATFLSEESSANPLFSALNRPNLDPNPAILKNPWVPGELLGGIVQATQSSQLACLAPAMASLCAIQAHSIDTVIDALKPGNNAYLGDTDIVDGKIDQNIQGIIESVQTSTINLNSDGTYTITASDGSQISAIVKDKTSTSITYSIRKIGSDDTTETLQIITGGTGLRYVTNADIIWDLTSGGNTLAGC